VISRYRLRRLTLVQQGVIKPSDVEPPLTDEERRWIKAGPTRLLAEVLACGDAVIVAGHPDHRCKEHRG
jgi:hypothetical protein